MDEEKQREQARLRKQRQRDKERVESVTSQSVTSQSVTEVEMFEGKPRYLVLSDGQVLDRANQPTSNMYIKERNAMYLADRLGGFRLSEIKKVLVARLKPNL